MSGEAVTRVTLGEPGRQVRVYFDADEQFADPIIEHQCRTCGAWWKESGHIPPCSSERHMADTLERIRRNIHDLTRPAPAPPEEGG